MTSGLVVCKRCGIDEPKDLLTGWFHSLGYRILNKNSATFDTSLDRYFCSRDCLESWFNNRKGRL